VSGKAELVDVQDPPTRLNEPAEAWYREVAAELADAGLIERVDVYILAMAAEAWGDFVVADRIRREKGWFTMGSTGQIVLGPWMKQKKDAMVVFERLVNHLPLTPVARARLGLAGLRAANLYQAMERELGDGGEIVDVIEVDPEAPVGLPGA
jgi:P27 family predicted phage terminase small subunit